MVVAIGDVNRDGRDDLVGGRPYARDHERYEREDGAVTVLPGARGGLTTPKAIVFGPRADGAGPANAAFGWTLAP